MSVCVCMCVYMYVLGCCFDIEKLKWLLYVSCGCQSERDGGSETVGRRRMDRERKKERERQMKTDSNIQGLRQQQPVLLQ